MSQISNIDALIASNVRRLRQCRDMSQEKLAEVTGLSRATIGRIEQETQNVSIGALKRIAHALDVDFMMLFLPNVAPFDTAPTSAHYAIVSLDPQNLHATTLDDAPDVMLIDIAMAMAKRARDNDKSAQTTALAYEAIQAQRRDIDCEAVISPEEELLGTRPQEQSGREENPES